MSATQWALLVVGCAAVSTCSCGRGSPTEITPAAAAVVPPGASQDAMNKLQLTSAAFANEASIPQRYTCEGQNVSPPLTWTGVPAETRSFALILDDPDAPDPRAPKRTWVHWVVFGIAPSARGFAEDVAKNGLPEGAREASNDWNHAGYDGPCPPVGRHRYFHKLYALDVALTGLDGKSTKAEVEHAMQGHVIAQVSLMGTYQKRAR